MKILVTGGNGYVGHHLIPLLANKRDEIFVLDRTDPVVKQEGNIEQIRLDIDYSLHDLKSIIEKVDVIVHLAAIVGYPECDSNPNQAWRTNLASTDFINDCRSWDKPLIFASTDTVYGRQPLKELSEDSLPNPQSIYAQSKKLAEDSIMRRGSCVILRFATGFGVSPKMRYDTIPNNMSRMAVKEGRITVYQPDAMRSFIHVSDMALALKFAVRFYSSLKNKIVNVGHPSLNVKKIEIARNLQEITGCKVDSIDGEDKEGRDYVMSYNRIANIGYKPQYTLKSGLIELVNFFEEGLDNSAPE